MLVGVRPGPCAPGPMVVDGGAHRPTFGRALQRTFAAGVAESGTVKAALRAMLLARLTAAPRLLAEMRRSGYYLDRIGAGADPFHFVTGRDYVLRGSPSRRRIERYAVHQEHESRARTSRYSAALRDGIELWRLRDDVGHDVRILLERTPDLERREGELSVVLRVDGERLCVVSFVHTRDSILIGRSQVHRDQAFEAFVRRFPSESARMYCLAALSGIATADGLTSVYAVAATSQVCYEAPLDQTFRRSYDEVWESIGGTRAGTGLYRLPATMPPSTEAPVVAKNRARARRRRARWDEVRSSAARASARFCVDG